MRLDDFCLLEANDQLDQLEIEGVLVADSDDEEQHSLFYAFEDFFVELYVHKARPEHLALIIFTQHTHRFRSLLEALPVDLKGLLHAA